ncbi:MAG: signal peptidase I [Patescibacteria group bacterium]
MYSKSTKTNKPEEKIPAKPGYRKQARLARPEAIAPPFKSSARDFVMEVIKVVAIALAIIIPVRYFLVQPFYVKGASMEPNFQDHEYLIIDEVSYRLSDPKRGDVVVIKNPQNRSEFFIKRVIGLPGEIIKISNGQVAITSDTYPSGVTLDESAYLAGDVYTKGSIETTLGRDEFFVMGDNRQASLDSRIFGQIKENEIIGRAWLRAWPINEWSHFSSPVYNYP